MSTNARTWFYQEPEHNGYALIERLNGTFWQARVVQLIFTRCTRVEPPFVCEGTWRGETVEIEWQPRDWLSLRGLAELTDLSEHVSQVLGFKPAFRYEDPEGRYVYEWHKDGAHGHSRWQAIQGKPAYRHPERLSAAHQ